MGKRRGGFQNVPAATYSERSSLGDAHVDAAITEITKLAQRAVATMTHYELTRESTLPMLFRDDDIAKLQAVRGMVQAHAATMSYMLQPSVFLFISYEDAQVPTIERDRLYIQPGRVGPLLNFVAAVKAVHDRYEEVKGVLRWLNRNATPGAIRFYWPTAMKLTPKSLIWADLREVPSRYSVPPNISGWLQPLRDAAATMAGAAMLPATAAERPRETMWLSFHSCPVKLDGNAGSTYNTDHMIYNL